MQCYGSVAVTINFNFRLYAYSSLKTSTVQLATLQLHALGPVLRVDYETTTRSLTIEPALKRKHSWNVVVKFSQIH